MRVLSRSPTSTNCHRQQPLPSAIRCRRACRPAHRQLSSGPARHRRQRKHAVQTTAAAPALAGFQGGAASIGAFLETAPPLMYLVYMLAAGFGLPCSEDALVVWVGAGIFTGRYGGAAGIAQVLAIVYIGVTVSDMVTFFLGSALRRGLFRTLKQRLFKDPAVVERAEGQVQRWSKAIGLVQRFSLGFRGPLCLVAGFLGVNSAVFASGVAAGAFGTMALQICAGYVLRFSPNAYLAALALVAAPNLCGHLAGPILTAVGLWSASRGPSNSSGAIAESGSKSPPDVQSGGEALGQGFS